MEEIERARHRDIEEKRDREKEMIAKEREKEKEMSCICVWMEEVCNSRSGRFQILSLSPIGPKL